MTKASKSIKTFAALAAATVMAASASASAGDTPTNCPSGPSNCLDVPKTMTWDIGLHPNESAVQAKLDVGIKTLTISGTGAMADFHPTVIEGSGTPWGANITSVERIVVLEGVTSIGALAFKDAFFLTHLEIAGSVTSIGEGAFYGCGGLETVRIRGHLTSDPPKPVIESAVEPPEISPSVFEAVNLASVTLYVPEASVESYKSAGVWLDFGGIRPNQYGGAAGEEPPVDDVTTQTFDAGVYPNESSVVATLYENGTMKVSGNGPMRDFAAELDDTPMWWRYRFAPQPHTELISPIKRLVIEDGVTAIGRYAFWTCDSLEDVSIASSVTSIGEYAFMGSVNLRSVTVFWEEPLSVDANVFDGVDVSTVTLITLLGKQADYKNSDKIWAEFASFLGSASVTHRRAVKGGQFGIVQNGASLQIVGTTQATTLRVYDVRGRMMMSRAVMPNERISVSRLARGTYMAKAAGKSVRFVRR